MNPPPRPLPPSKDFHLTLEDEATEEPPTNEWALCAAGASLTPALVDAATENDASDSSRLCSAAAFEIFGVAGTNEGLGGTTLGSLSTCWSEFSEEEVPPATTLPFGVGAVTGLGNGPGNEFLAPPLLTWLSFQRNKLKQCHTRTHTYTIALKNQYTKFTFKICTKNPDNLETEQIRS